MNDIHAPLSTPDSSGNVTTALIGGLSVAVDVDRTAPAGEVSTRVGESVAESASHINASPGAIVLESPIRRGDQVITSLTLRKPDAGTLRGIKLAELLQMDVGSLTTLLPRISSPTLTAADAAKLDPADLVAIATEVGNFFLTKAQRDFPSA